MAAAPRPFAELTPHAHTPAAGRSKARPGLRAKADHTSHRVIEKDRENARRAAVTGGKLTSCWILSTATERGDLRGLHSRLASDSADGSMFRDRGAGYIWPDRAPDARLENVRPLRLSFASGKSR
jgi:hypothetical protein